MESALLPVFRALRSADVEYLVVGGVAVVLHGHLRVTGDLDLVIHLTEENSRRTIQALTGLGYQPRIPVPAAAFSDERTRASWIEEKNMLVFTLWSPSGDGLQIDIFAKEPFDFASAYARAEMVEIEDAVIAVASIIDLIAMKRIAGRAKDVDDIAALERIAAMRRTDG
jgi:hypothetical protein